MLGKEGVEIVEQGPARLLMTHGKEPNPGARLLGSLGCPAHVVGPP